MPVVQHHRRIESHLWVATDIRQQGAVRVDELQSFPAVGDEALQRWRAWAERRWPEQERLLLDFLVFVQKDDHQPCAAAEPAKQRALADPGGRGDVVGRHGLSPAFVDEPTCRLEQRRPVARRVAPLRWARIAHRQHRQAVPVLGDAHLATLAQLE
jgi:hypothetical protein